MNDQALEIYRHAIAALCRQNGGTLSVPAPPQDLIDMPFSIWFEMKDDGTMAFTLDEHVGPAH